MSEERSGFRDRSAKAREQVIGVHERAQRTLLWQVWDRMLEIEFVDRSVALAGKAFVSFFPLVIVVASFVPERTRRSITNTLTHRLGIRGEALTEAKQAFASSDDVRKATGILGLVLMVFFATSFTTALQRVYLRAWRRQAGKKAGEYAALPDMVRRDIGDDGGVGWLAGVVRRRPAASRVPLISVVITSLLWWFTAWFMLMGQVRWRVLLPSGVVTAVALGGYAVSATIWMPNVVTRNQNQFGFFGVALALVTWFSGSSICVLIGACAAPVFAADTGRVGAFIRGRDPSLLVAGAEPSLPAPERSQTFRDAFRRPKTRSTGVRRHLVRQNRRRLPAAKGGTPLPCEP